MGKQELASSRSLQVQEGNAIESRAYPDTLARSWWVITSNWLGIPAIDINYNIIFYIEV
jgi:hypothetical protein